MDYFVFRFYNNNCFGMGWRPTTNMF